jgi:hypothetical protein
MLRVRLGLTPGLIEPVCLARMVLSLASDDAAMLGANNFMVEAGSICFASAEYPRTEFRAHQGCPSPGCPLALKAPGRSIGAFGRRAKTRTDGAVNLTEAGRIELLN